MTTTTTMTVMTRFFVSPTPLVLFFFLLKFSLDVFQQLVVCCGFSFDSFDSTYPENS